MIVQTWYQQLYWIIAFADSKVINSSIKHFISIVRGNLPPTEGRNRRVNNNSRSRASAVTIVTIR